MVNHTRVKRELIILIAIVVIIFIMSVPVLLFSRRRINGSEQAVAFGVRSGGEEQRILAAGQTAIAEGERPQTIYG